MCRTLRLTPELCPPYVIELISDLANAAEVGGHSRWSPEYSGKRIHVPERPAVVKVPQGFKLSIQSMGVRKYAVVGKTFA